MPLSDATVQAINGKDGATLVPIMMAMGEALKTTQVVHAGETGMKVAGPLNRLHVLANTAMTWIGCPTNRGKKAFDAYGITGEFLGTLIHDGWKPCRDLACSHALWNAHHLRELTCAFEEMGQAWARRRIDLLVCACHEVDQAGGGLMPDRPMFYRPEYFAMLAAGEAANSRAPPSGKCGSVYPAKHGAQPDQPLAR